MTIGTHRGVYVATLNDGCGVLYFTRHYPATVVGVKRTHQHDKDETRKPPASHGAILERRRRTSKQESATALLRVKKMRQEFLELVAG